MSSSRMVTMTVQKQVNQQVLGIDPNQIGLYKEAFDMIDTQNQGFINKDQIKKLFKSFGQKVSLEEVDDMIKKVDQDGNGTVSFDEFITMIQPVTINEEIQVLEEDEVIKAFRKFDTDGDGKITNSEFKFILTKMGDKLPEEDAERVFKLADLNHDGVLDFVEFVDFWKAIIKK